MYAETVIISVRYVMPTPLKQKTISVLNHKRHRSQQFFRKQENKVLKFKCRRKKEMS